MRRIIPIAWIVCWLLWVVHSVRSGRRGEAVGRQGKGDQDGEVLVRQSQGRPAQEGAAKKDQPLRSRRSRKRRRKQPSGPGWCG